MSWNVKGMLFATASVMKKGIWARWNTLSMRIHRNRWLPNHLHRLLLRWKNLCWKIQRRVAALDERIAIGDNRRSIVEKYVTMDHLTRDAVEVLIDHICVGKRIPKTKDVPIEIHWNF